MAEEAAQREQAQRAAEQEAAQRQRAAVSEEVSLNTQQLPPMEDHLSDMNPLEAISSAKLASAVQQEKVYTGMGEGTEIDEEKKLSGELAKIFRKYREMPDWKANWQHILKALNRKWRFQRRRSAILSFPVIQAQISLILQEPLCVR